MAPFVLRAIRLTSTCSYSDILSAHTLDTDPHPSGARVSLQREYCDRMAIRTCANGHNRGYYPSFVAFFS
jgi:hypothetical protein